MVSPQLANEIVKQLEGRTGSRARPIRDMDGLFRSTRPRRRHAVLGKCDAKVAESERMMFPESDEKVLVELQVQLRGL